MNQYKALRHKTLPDTYAYPADMPIEFSHISTPQLMPATATMQGLKEYYKDHPKALQQLEDYDLITVMVIPLQMPAKVTFWPNGNVSVWDKEGNDMPQLQGGWMSLYFEFLKQEGYNPANIEFKAFINEAWVNIIPNLTSNGWSYMIEKELP